MRWLHFSAYNKHNKQNNKLVESTLRIAIHNDDIFHPINKKKGIYNKNNKLKPKASNLTPTVAYNNYCEL